MRAVLALALAVLAACGAPRADAPAARSFAAALDARTAELRCGDRRYRASSAVEERAGRLLLRTRIVGDGRDRIGDAVARVYAEAEALARERGLQVETNGAFDQAVLAWDGRQVSCSLLTVGF